MTFDSFDFALFLPLAFIAYWLLAAHFKWQNVLVLALSYFFYACSDYRFLALIASTTLISYSCARLIDNSASKSHRRLWNMVNIVANLAILFYFKYFNFFAESVEAMLNAVGIESTFTLSRIILPIGISFYTFQALSYTIDVTHRRIKAERSLIAYAAYISFFPQLVAGPIERASDLLPQFKRKRTFDYALAADGVRRMLWGFFKKMAIADSCAHTVNVCFADYAQCNSIMLFCGMILFSIQIYADFSGYSDIAVGCAQLFGIRLSDNFRCPYFATSITELWRRWHITLTGWFRDYVYIPLGGSRCRKSRIIFNTIIVFALSGLWHGAQWHFVVWGVLNGILFIPDIISGKKKRYADCIAPLSPTRLLNMLLTFLLFSLIIVFFRAESIESACQYLFCMASAGPGSVSMKILAILLCSAFMIWVEWLNRNCRHALQCIKLPAIGRYAFYYLIIFMILWNSGKYTQFIYFQF